MTESVHRAQWIGAALALLAIVAAAARAPAAPAAMPPADRFGAELSAGRFAAAAAVADSLVRRRERHERLAPARAAAVLDSLGARLFGAGSPEAWAAAERLFRAALERREHSLGPDDPDVASSLSTIAILYDYQGRWREALPLVERALAIRRRARGERHAETASSLRQLGLMRFQLGEFAEAEAPLERSVAIYADLGAGQEAKLADGHNNLGELSRVQGRLDSAEAHFRRGLDVARASLPPTAPVRMALENNLAGLFKDRGRYDEAEPLLEDAPATLEAAGGSADAIATARLNLAEIRRLQGRAEDAEPLYERALEEAGRALGERHPGLVLFLNQAAVCAQDLGHFARAESLYVRAGDVIEQSLGAEHPLRAQNLHDLARLRLAAGRAAEADSLLARVIALRERAYGPAHPEAALALVDLARARLAERRDSGAAAPLARAIAILDSAREYPEARLEAYALRAEWNARAGRRPAALADMAVALAAVDSLRSWRGGGDETRAAFLAGRLALYDRMAGWQIEEGQVEAALATHERGRARVLLDQIAAGGVDVRAGIPGAALEPLLAAERDAEARLAAAHRDIEWTQSDPALSERDRYAALAPLAARRDSAAFDLARARRRIEDASPLWRSVLSREGRIPPLAELRDGLVPDRGLMLIYHVGERGSIVFAVPRRGAVRALPLALEDEDAARLGVRPGPLTDAMLERIVTGARSAAWPAPALGVADLLGGTRAGGFLELPLRAADGPDSCELRLHALWRALVPAALRPAVLAARTAIVVPDGALHLIAFEALVTRPRDGRRGTRYWLDDGPALTYGPSATSLMNLALRARRAPPAAGAEPVLSVSDVAFAKSPSLVTPAATRDAGALLRGRSWAALPGTRLETEAIRAAFGAGRVAVLEDTAAREAAVRAALAGRRYVHLATHGFVDVSGRHLVAGLVLAPPAAPGGGSGEDGVLELFEIHRLPLTCDLAVLSACETARGPRVAGEGAFALSRGFLAAGARRVVASLWAVDDRPAAAIVGALFQSLAGSERRGLPPDVALELRDAKRAVRNDPRWADPFYWAPFVLSGP